MCPYFDHVAYIFNINGSNGLQRSQDPLLFTHVNAVSEQKWLNYAGE